MNCGENTDTMFSYKNVCNFSCSPGYNLEGANKVTCTSAATWSDTMPSCKAVQCPTVPKLENVIVDCGGDSYGNVCNFSCAPGYNLVGANKTTCTSSAEWSNSTPDCEAVQCTALREPENGLMNCGENTDRMFSYKNVCNFSCSPGYNLVGANKVTCTSAATWTDTMPSCKAVQCPTVPKLENVIVDCGGDSYGNVCSFSCAPGYNLVGANKVTCTSAATWTDTMPSCKAVQCPTVPELENVIVDCGGDSYGNVCSFSCAPGYNLVGAKALTCTSSAEWSQTFPHCEAIICPVPEQQSNQIMKCSSRSELRQNSTCTFNCKPGFLLQGAETLQCTADGQWNAATPTCEVVICPILEVPLNGHINCSLREPVYSSQCSFTCDQDYTLEGQALLICSHHGNWTEEIPTCNAVATHSAIIASGVTAGGAVLLSGLSLTMWILKRIKNKTSKFELSSSSDIDVPPQTYRNNIDSLI